MITVYLKNGRDIVIPDGTSASISELVLTVTNLEDETIAEFLTSEVLGWTYTSEDEVEE